MTGESGGARQSGKKHRHYDGRRFAGDRQRVARPPRYELIAFLSPEPAVKRGTRLAAICIVSPVRGLRPSRAPRSATWNLPKPVKLTSPPDFSSSSIELITASTAAPASYLLRPLFDATLSTNSAFVVMTTPPFYRAAFSRRDLDDAGEANSDIGRPRAKSPRFPAFCGISDVRFKSENHGGPPK